jgi:hypothetical protein
MPPPPPMGLRAPPCTLHVQEVLWNPVNFCVRRGASGLRGLFCTRKLRATCNFEAEELGCTLVRLSTEETEYFVDENKVKFPSLYSVKGHHYYLIGEPPLSHPPLLLPERLFLLAGLGYFINTRCAVAMCNVGIKGGKMVCVSDSTDTITLHVGQEMCMNYGERDPAGKLVWESHRCLCPDCCDPRCEL